MNERIKELANKAGFDLQYNCGPLTGEGEIYYAKEFEKFAELIVKECLLYAKDGDIDFMKFMIKKHFGVEE